MEGWIATTRHGATKKEEKRLKAYREAVYISSGMQADGYKSF